MFDLEQLPRRFESFLQRRLPGRVIECGSPQPLIGGYSRLMTKLGVFIDGVQNFYVLRSDPPHDKHISSSNSDQEWQLLEALTRSGQAYLPAAHWYDSDGSELGSKSIVMEAVLGQSLLTELRAADDGKLASQTAAFLELVATVHATQLSVLPENIARSDDWDSYIDARIQFWRSAEAEQIDSNPYYRYMACWLEQNRPKPAPLRLVHGDLQPSNVMVEDATGKLLAVDWELARIGDPREDLGWCRWVGTMQPPNLVDRDINYFCKTYSHFSGLGPDIINPESLAFFSILAGVMPVHGLAQQVNAFSEGRNNSIVAAYLVGALSMAHEQWLNASVASSNPIDLGQRS